MNFLLTNKIIILPSFVFFFIPKQYLILLVSNIFITAIHFDASRYVFAAFLSCSVYFVFVFASVGG